MLKPPPIYRLLQIRRWNFLDTENFILELKLFPLPAATSFEFLTFIISFCQEFLTRRFPLTAKAHERPFDLWFDGECRTSNCLKRSLERTKSKNDFVAWLGHEKLFFDCVDTSVEITGIINSVIQKTKRLAFGATLIVSLVEERDLLLTEFSLLNSNLFC